MSLEDVRSIASLGADSTASDHCDSRSLDRAQRDRAQRDPGLVEDQSQTQDGIVLDHIATLSLERFNPRDFKGRFSKIQSKSRKRTRIIRGRGRHPRDPSFLLLVVLFGE